MKVAYVGQTHPKNGKATSKLGFLFFNPLNPWQYTHVSVPQPWASCIAYQYQYQYRFVGRVNSGNNYISPTYHIYCSLSVPLNPLFLSQNLIFWSQSWLYNSSTLSITSSKSISSLALNICAPGGYSDLSWTGVCRSSLKTHTHLFDFGQKGTHF